VDVEALKKDVSGSVSEQMQHFAEEAEERAFLRMRHPDWKKTVNTDEFRNWSLQGGPTPQLYAQYKLLEQSDPAKANAMVQAFQTHYPTWWKEKGSAMWASSAADAIKLLDGFSEHQKKAVSAAATRQRNQARLERAVVPRGTSSPPDSGISDDEAFERGVSKTLRKRAIS
jgi:hypothetical protein